MYANAGGVTVSYFEWVKNLSHIRFGRMRRRQEETRNQLLVEELGRIVTESGLNTKLSENFIEKYSAGAGEIELVRSGLDDTMVNAYQSIREVWHGRDDVNDLRLAAYLVAIERIAPKLSFKGTLKRYLNYWRSPPIPLKLSLVYVYNPYPLKLFSVEASPPVKIIVGE